jgi:hypothetical protein
MHIQGGWLMSTYDDDESKEELIRKRTDKCDENDGDHEDIECPSDEEEIEGSGFSGSDYIKSMGIDENYDNDDFGGVFHDE